MHILRAVVPLLIAVLAAAPVTALRLRSGQAQSARPAATIVDARDGQAYPIVDIAGLTWFARNLSFNADRSSCPQGDASTCGPMGRLYPWDVAISACPAGWRLSTEDDWQRLEAHLGMDRKELALERLRGAGLGDQLKIGGASQLEIPLAGWRNPDGTFRTGNGNDRAAALWTATKASGDSAWHRDVSSARSGIWRSPVTFTYSLSVRCVKD